MDLSWYTLTSQLQVKTL